MSRLLTRATLGGGLLVVLIAAAVALAARTTGKRPGHSGTAAGVAARPTASEPVQPRRLTVRNRALSDGGRLVTELDHAQPVIDDPSSTGQALANAAEAEQVGALQLYTDTGAVRDATLAALAPQARASMRANVAAALALSDVSIKPRTLPRWRIVQPPAPSTLLGYFQQAQAKTGVPWQYLAAIEFIETRFGRVLGTSTAGAQGPMQFLPGTWSRYGSGSIDSPRDAILAAGRFLVANGAPGNMPAAIYAYNNSRGYVEAVEDYAGWMRSDPRAYDGYYDWQVIYALASGPVILPVGYPAKRAEPLP